MGGAEIREGEKEKPQGKVVLTNNEVIKKIKPHEQVAADTRERRDFVNNFEKLSGQDPEQKKFLQDHRIDG